MFDSEPMCGRDFSIVPTICWAHAPQVQDRFNPILLADVFKFGFGQLSRTVENALMDRMEIAVVDHDATIGGVGAGGERDRERANLRRPL